MKTILFSLVLVHGIAYAQLDQHQQQGLKDTQRLLVTPEERNAAIKGDKKAIEADQKAEALTGGGVKKEELYGIASKVMETITHEAKGDPAKMQQMLIEAQTNPQAFYDKYFSAEAKARTRALANEIEKSGVRGSPPR